MARTAIATVGTQTLPSVKLKSHQDMDPIAETVPAAIAAYARAASPKIRELLIAEMDG
ncbi:hypothetical protein [Rhizobium mongolense]|uniref:Uncharacterized protein n=1 Tax=Rhizobium mongolense TaxID=57676 RepID=A0ABR6INC6_9HYPH|nr:hypothetical protein [Rhizobium mongolense]MBB4229386.1 hypothetical protein [Rhizobium mongolense]